MVSLANNWDILVHLFVPMQLLPGPARGDDDCGNGCDELPEVDERFVFGEVCCLGELFWEPCLFLLFFSLSAFSEALRLFFLFISDARGRAASESVQ